MANRFAGLDPTWAHLPTPTPTHAAASHYCSFPAAAFENEALTSALRASMAPAYAYTSTAAAASPFSPATPSSSTTSSASELLSSGHDAPAPSSGPAGRRPPARALKGPKAGRVSKRKPRPSRRPQTTYITADPANFRRMVQEVTGLPAPVPGPSSAAAPAAPEVSAAAAPSWTPAPSFVLPTLDTSAFLLLDRAAPAPEGKSSSGYAPVATAPAAAAGADDSSALLEMEAMIDFPTLESWGII
ncbi:calmodulin-binding protein 25 [Panicum miliaceum]|uniref:Calmodulin-binding protein 25 n=1 Tax=Panicum miliaceum TaxID=4540 RepID=A0A3L6SPH7_PANMI|nr:calmodulin-binding protein 25 [Panicum miliaceum]